RNVSDEQLLSIKKNGGVVQAVAFGEHVQFDPNMANRYAEFRKINDEFYRKPVTEAPAPVAPAIPRRAPPCPIEGAPSSESSNAESSDSGLSAERYAEYSKRMAAARAKYAPPGPATLKQLVDHIDYLVSKIGIDHVGISSDFGGGGGVQGWSDAGESLNVTIELLRRGYSAEQIEKLWGGNLLRVWEQVEQAAKRAQRR